MRGLINLLTHPVFNQNLIHSFTKLVWWQCNKVFFNLPSIVRLTPDRNIICYPRNSFGSLIVYTKFPEYLEMKLLLSVLKKNSVFVDVGAGIGDFSIIASQNIRTGKIYAFEPNPEPLEIFKKNVRINDLSNVHISNTIISDKDGYEHFSFHETSELSKISKNGVKIPSKTLDSIIKEHKIDHVDLLKIDVEGAEDKVLHGAKKSLKSGLIHGVILEIRTTIDKNSINNHPELIALNKNDFKIFHFVNNKEIQLLHKLPFPKTLNVLAVHNNQIKKFQKVIGVSKL